MMGRSVGGVGRWCWFVVLGGRWCRRVGRSVGGTAVEVVEAVVEVEAVKVVEVVGWGGGYREAEGARACGHRDR